MTAMKERNYAVLSTKMIEMESLVRKISSNTSVRKLIVDSLFRVHIFSSQRRKKKKKKTKTDNMTHPCLERERKNLLEISLDTLKSNKVSTFTSHYEKLSKICSTFLYFATLT
jgi:hypothetical protein